MSGLLFLNKSDFSIKQGDKGQIMSLNSIPTGMTLVLFYTNECPYCEEVLKVFKQLPNRMNGCLFAMINLTIHREIIDISQQTIAPITYVPDLILYVNGSPFVRYDGNPNTDSILQFINEINKQIQHINFISNDSSSNQQHTTSYRQQQSPPSIQNPSIQQQQQPKTNQQQIPGYTIGIPLYGFSKKDNVCYLGFNDAYKNPISA
jgi:thiol-disulfide isomerase/thioredoxin